MDTKTNIQIPFDFYDFFGYLFPGAIMSLFLLILMSYAFPGINLTKITAILNIDNEPIVSGLLKIFTIIVIVYAIGHFIATISSIVIDKILISGISGYPILFLLGLKKEPRPFIAATYKYLFLSINSLIILSLLTTNRVIFIALLVIIAALVSIRIVIEFSRQTNWKVIDKLRDLSQARYYLAPMRFIDVFAKSANATVGGDRRFPSQFIEKYDKILSKYDLDYRALGSENYWLSYFLTVRNDSHSLTLFRTWLHLYGFARNLSAASFMVSLLITLIIFIVKPPYIQLARIQLIITYVIAWAFLARYWILYRSYYTKSIIRAFVAMNCQQDSDNA